MTFEHGLAANEFELQEKLNAFILSTDGWRKISQPSDFESVYYSAGEDGYKDIYVKTRAGLTELAAPMGGQADLGDGYSGYLNFFVYQFYPEEGDGYDGYGEAGRFGPYFVYCNTHQTIWLQRVSVQSAANRKWDALGGDDSMDQTFIDELPTGYNMNSPFWEHQVVYDGHTYIYYHTTKPAFFKFDMGNEGSKIIATYLSINTSDSRTDVTFYRDPKTRKEYVWDSTVSSNFSGTHDGDMCPEYRNYGFKRWNLEAEVCETGFNLPRWPTSNYEVAHSRLMWDGHNHLYMSRGDGGTSTLEWAKYHIPSDTWTVLSPEFPTQHPTQMIWLDKLQSGFDYHRIYILNSLGVSYINIDENSGMPLGSWQLASGLPWSYFEVNRSRLFHNGRKWFYFYIPSTNPYYNRLYMADIEPGTLNWVYEGQDYWPSDDAWSAAISYMDGYASRVRASVREATEYWFMGSSDHITVITKADDQTTYCYMGALDALAVTPTSPHGTVTSRVHAGTSVEIMMSRQKGEFVVGEKMMIADVVDGGGGIQVGDVEGVPRKFMPSEQFTIINVNPGVSITADEIKNNYSVGSKIAYDPQPVGITLGNMNKIQMLNHINTVDDSASFDMAENIAYLTSVEDSIINASGNDERHNSFVLWPVLASKSGDTAVFSGPEVRGVLRGMYAVSGTVGLEDGDTIVVGNNVFRVFNIDNNKSYMYAFGPLG